MIKFYEPIFLITMKLLLRHTLVRSELY